MGQPAVTVEIEYRRATSITSLTIRLSANPRPQLEIKHLPFRPIRILPQRREPHYVPGATVTSLPIRRKARNPPPAWPWATKWSPNRIERRWGTGDIGGDGAVVGAGEPQLHLACGRDEWLRWVT